MGISIITADRTKKSAPAPARDVLNLELDEVREISDMMLKKIDAQVRRLEALEAAIDRKRSALESLIKQAGEQEQKLADRAAGENRPETRGAAPAEVDRRIESLELRLKTDESLLSLTGKRLASLEQSLLRPEHTGLMSGSAMRGQEIVALRGKGLASREIAEVLDMPLGEVDLILELRTQ